MKTLFAAGAATLLVTATQPAAAARYVAVLTGTVATSEDSTGVFGGTGSSLDGADFRLVFNITLPAPGASGSEDATSAFLLGGAANGGPAFSRAILSINGFDQRFFGADQSAIQRRNNDFGMQDMIFFESNDYQDDARRNLNKSVQAGILSEINDFITTTDLTAPLRYTLQPGDTSVGNFYVYQANPRDLAVSAFANGQLNFTSISYAPAAVPEPAAWALLVLGFGLVGASKRRSRGTGLATNSTSTSAA